MTDPKPAYRANLADLPVLQVKPADKNNTAAFNLQMISGMESSVMIANRDGGYHTKPHFHDSEQINWIMEGEIWFFVDGRGFRCKPGDFMRIPRGKTHWAWNRGPAKCRILEVHTPPLTGEADLNSACLRLLGSDDDQSKYRGVPNQWGPFDQAEVDAIEARAVSEEG
jgi:mannose-6-phosphate isomerase-like protein (cupin superfamily)